MRSRTVGRLLAVVGVAALVAAACNGNDDDADDDGGDGAAEDVEIPEGPPVSGEPFDIGVVYVEGVSGIDLPDIRGGAEAAAEYVNTELGGIGGRPVEIVACNTEADPAGDTACAQEFVGENVLGVAGISPTWGDNGLPIIAEAETAFVGLPVSNAEFIGETSHPFGGGSLTAFPALAKYAADELEIESASIIYADLAAGETAANILLAEPLMERGVEQVELIPEAVGAADYTSAVVAANDSDPDAIYILFSSADCARVIQAAQQVGVTAQLLGAGSCADPNALEIAGEDALEGFLHNAEVHYLAEEGSPQFEDAEIYRDRVERYSDVGVTNFSANAFSEVVTLVDIANGVAESEGVDAVSAASVLAAIESASGQPIFMAETLDASDPVELAGVATGVYNKTVRIYQIEDGETVDTGAGWVNGFD